MSKLLEIANIVHDDEERKASTEVEEITNGVTITDVVSAEVIEAASINPEEL